MMPEVSVVMGVRDGAAHLPATIDSVLAQEGEPFEFVVVDDGSTDPAAADTLTRYARQYPRVRVITKPNEGLTRALIDACGAVRGALIARIDVGDRMAPRRLMEQAAFLRANPEVVFVSSHTEFCAPEWEPLWVERGADTGPHGMRVMPPPPAVALLAGPTHHGSVMFRRDAYVAAGGYRAPFYFAQDWDLWHRLAEKGAFHIVPRVLYRCRLFPGSLSMLHGLRQRRLLQCIEGAARARRGGQSEQRFLDAAARIRPSAGGGRRHPPLWLRGAGEYFIARNLSRRGSPACERYFRGCLRGNPFHVKAWLGLVSARARKRHD